MERCFNAKTHFRTNLRLFGPLCPVLVVQKAPARKKSLCRQCWETFRPIDNIRLQSLMCLATSRNGFFLQRLYSHNSRVSLDHSKTASKKVFVCLVLSRVHTSFLADLDSFPGYPYKGSANEGKESLIKYHYTIFRFFQWL